MICAAMSRTWLGGRDSNPDTMVQSHVSYRWTTSQYQPGVRDRRETSSIANPNARQQGTRAGTGRRLSNHVVVAASADHPFLLHRLAALLRHGPGHLLAGLFLL